MRPCGCRADAIVFGHTGCPAAPPARTKPILGCPAACRIQHAVPKAELKPVETP